MLRRSLAALYVGCILSACGVDAEPQDEAPVVIVVDDQTSSQDDDLPAVDPETSDDTDDPSGSTDPDGSQDPDDSDDAEDPTDPTDPADPDDPVSGSDVGGPCEKDGDCTDASARCFLESSGFPGGYCVVEGCMEGSCPEGTGCWRFQDEVSRCLLSCQSHDECRDGYRCDSDGVCWPGCTPGSCPEGQMCGTDGQCIEEECTPGSCSDGLVCRNGRCIVDVGQVPAGPVPACNNVPDWQCTGTAAHCAELVPFEPDQGPGWWDYPINGETASNEYRSWIRRDVMMLVKYAAAKVDCLAAGWTGNGGALGLGDMSEPDGAIPGASIGSPGHPQGTHVNGFDMDIAYYQVNTQDNRLRAVCDHVSGGQDQYHCLSEPYLLDVWRTALFLAHLHDAVIHNRFQLRVIGVDGKVGPLVTSAITQLCDAGWYSGYACQQNVVTWEETNQNRGWYYFHHHHLHISTNGLHPSVQPYLADDDLCLAPQCSQAAPADDPRHTLEY